MHELYDDDSSNDGFVIDDVLVDIYAKGEIFATLSVNGRSTEAKLDTGAKYNVIPLQVFQYLKSNERIDKTKSIKLVAFGGDSFNTIGVAEIMVKIKDRKEKLTFHILDKKVKTLLGLCDRAVTGTGSQTPIPAPHRVTRK